MSAFFNDFSKPSKEKWQEQLLSELKGADLSTLNITDEIEDISYASYQYVTDVNVPSLTPGVYPFTRGYNRENNGWNNGLFIEVTDETQANKEAMKWFDQGVSALIFKAGKSNIDWSKTLEGIHLQHIHTQFHIVSFHDFVELNALTKDNFDAHLCIDPLDNELSKSEFEEVIAALKSKQKRTFIINGFKIQQCGANISQELAFALSVGHDILVELIDYGLTIDEAAACLSFNLGVGQNFVHEIAKFRAFREGWSTIIHQYNPEHNCSYNCSITATIGHVNKSLEDPYTNLLRQTTESLSAVVGGVETMVVLPYDLYSQNGTSELAQRMALNISNILSDESLLGKVMDPYGGSYNMELLTQLLGEKAWEQFKELDKRGGMKKPSANELFSNSVQAVRIKRLERLKEAKDTLIGVNKFPNPDGTNQHWKPLKGYLGLDMLNLEIELKK